MTYWDISQMSNDPDLQSREFACAAQENAQPDPYAWVTEHRLDLASSPGWSEAWASAIAGGNQTPGRDGAVITDGMILSATQALIAGG